MDKDKHIASQKEVEEFVDQALSQIRESDLDFDDWDVNYFIEASPLRAFLSEQKQLIGKRIDTILTMGCIFNNDDIADGEIGFLDLDEPVVIILEDIQMEIWCRTESRVKIGFNSLTLKEKSYQPYDWSDCSSLFKADVIGQRVVGFDVKGMTSGFYDSLGLGDRPDGGDYFDSFGLILENGKQLVFSGAIEYMNVFAGSRRGHWLYRKSDHLICDYRELEGRGTDYLNFYPGNALGDDGMFIPGRDLDKEVYVYDDDFYMFITAIYSVLPDFDKYDDTVIYKDDWLKILDAWDLLCFAENFDDVFEKLCSVSYENHTVENTSVLWLLNHWGRDFANAGYKDHSLFIAFDNWAMAQLETHDCITVIGF